MTSPHPAPAPGPSRPRPAPVPDPPLSVWVTAQQDARTQRRARCLPESMAHPAKMLPAIAATAIERYTEPGDLVADPMCGIGISPRRACSSRSGETVSDMIGPSCRPPSCGGMRARAT